MRGEIRPSEQCLVVQKFGGSSVADPEKIKAVAQRVVASRREGNEVVVVVSAMGRATDDLWELARAVASDPHRRELDMLLATGETVSAALLAMAIRDCGEEAIALTGSACGIATNSVHTNARILSVSTDRVRRELFAGKVVVVTGFQGLSATGEVTTLGRGGSDTTATALAAALGAQRCQILTDVDAVHSADPRYVERASPMHEIHCEEMQELSWHGAQVMKAEAVEFAESNGVDFEICAAFGDRPGTRVVSKPRGPDGAETFVPRRLAVAGVAGRTDLLSILLQSARGEERAWLLKAVSGYDLVFGRMRRIGCELLLSTREIPNPPQLIRELGARLGGAVSVIPDLGAISLVGFGIGSRPGSLLRAATVLSEAQIRVLDSFSSRSSLSFVVLASEVQAGVVSIHRAMIENQESTDDED